MAIPIEIKNRILFSKDDSNSLIKCLMVQRNTTEFCDVTLIVRGRRFALHKAVLACSSPYFRSMFSSRMREQHSGEVDLTHSLLIDCSDSFQKVLDYMYVGEIHITLDNCIDVLKIADFLLMDDLKDFVKEFFLSHGHLNISNVIYVWDACLQLNQPDVCRVSLALIKSRFQDYFVQSGELLDVPEDLFCRMLNDKAITQFSDVKDCIEMLLQWMRHNDYCGKGILQYIDNIDLLELKIITLEEIKFLLRDHKSCDTLVKVKSAIQKKVSKPITYEEFEKDALAGDIKGTDSVLIAVNSQLPMRYLKILLYSIKDQCWYHLPVHYDKLVHSVPSRLNACSLLFQDHRLHMFLGYNLPYPTDMLRIHILVVDIRSGEHWLLSFRHRYNQTECCQTTLTDDRSVPPAMCYCNGYLCVVGNMRGTGQIYLCDMLTQTYLCYQIPSTRFVSLARAVSKKDRQIYIWSRHRFGHEEYCVNKEVSFSVFDVRTKSFNAVDIPPPPGIDYGHFGDTHVLCLEDDRVVVHSPGTNSYYWDETIGTWRIFRNKIDRVPRDRMPVEMPYTGCEVYCYNEGQLFTLQNPAAYTTATVVQSHSSTDLVVPPPTDGISLITSGRVDRKFVHKLNKVKQFDPTYTDLIHKQSSGTDYDTETSVESGVNRTAESDLDSDGDYEYDGFVYDEDIYGLYEEY